MLLLDLLGQLIELLKRREELDRRKYDAIVVPMIADFEQLHADYISSFRRYQEFIDANPIITPDHPLFGALEADHLFSESLRKRILRFERLSYDEPIAALPYLIVEYLTVATRVPLEDHEDSEGMFHISRTCMPRKRFYTGLRKITLLPLVQQRLSATALLECIVHNLNERYANIGELHTFIREKLLRV